MRVLLPAGRFAVLVLCAALCAAAEDTFEGVERIVAIGDVHGDYDRFIELLHTAKLIDGQNAWVGGKTHLVLTGDFIDRGPAARKVMDLLIDLGPQAEKAGGRVHALIGNHEAMNIYGDLRYVSKADYESYKSPKSEELRNEAMEAAMDELRAKGSSTGKSQSFRKQFEADHPLGWVEQRLSFSASGKYGKWLLRQNVIIRINDIVFLHGGISPKYAAATRKEINDEVRSELRDFSKLPKGMAMDPEGPLWYRGLSQLPENDKSLRSHLDKVLEKQQARHIVIGHTPGVAVMPRFGGMVIGIDVGLWEGYGGPPAFLLVEGSKFFAVHRGRQIDLPVEGGTPLEYLRMAAALDPPDSQLRKLLRR